jgi:hypothetical protein
MTDAVNAAAPAACPEPTLPGLTLESRAEIFGATYREQCEDEARFGWLSHWSGRHGVAPDRWKAWKAAGRPAPDRAELSIAGEPHIVKAFRAALDAVPDPVAWYVVGHALVVCGGDQEAGSVRALPPLPRAPRAEWHLVQLHVADDGKAAHEIGHVHTIDPPEFLSRISAARAEEVVASAVGLASLRGDDALEQMKRRAELDELAADRLASWWLRRRIDTTSGICGERRRRGMDLDIARHLERAASIRGGDQ